MTTQTKRRSIFERFMPKTDAAEAEGTLRALEEQLANAGVEKKEITFDKDVYESMLKALSKEKGILEALAKAVDGLLTKVSDAPPAELRNKIIATVMSHMAQVDGEDEVVEEEVVVEEDAVGDEMPVPVEEEEEELMNFAKTLIKENNAMHEDVKALAALVPAFIDVAASVQKLVPLVKEADKISDLETQMKDMQKKLNARPRVASKDNGNIFKDAMVEQELKEGTDGEATFFGHKVKKS
jgi:hypothetical protein